MTENAKVWWQKRRQNNSVFVNKAKDNPCMDCGIKYNSWVMEFDHRPGEIKLDDVKRMKSRESITKIQAEINKCDLVCANCHRTREYKRHYTPSAI